MGKYSFILTCSKNYIYGLNAILNGLDRNGNTADVNVLWWENSHREFDEVFDNYPQKVKEAGFGFDVIFTDLAEFLSNYEVKNDNVWKLHFGRWKFIDVIKDKYDAVSQIGADCCIVDNVMNWFEVAHKSGMLIVGDNAMGSYSFKYNEIVQANDVPIADLPCFFNPKIHNDVMQRVYEIGLTKKTGDMPALYYSIMEHKRNYIALPDNLWVHNVFYSDLIKKDWLNGVPIILSLRTKVSMFHKKYWSQVVINSELSRMPEGDTKVIAKHNFEIFHWFYKYFNTECKLRLKWIDC